MSYVIECKAVQVHQIAALQVIKCIASSGSVLHVQRSCSYVKYTAKHKSHWGISLQITEQHAAMGCLAACMS